MRLNRNLVVLSCLLLLAATGLFAQGTTGALEGKVTQGGAPLPGVSVSIAAPTLQGTRTSVTNEGGNYSFPAIPPGEYTVTFSLAGLHRVAPVRLLQLGGVPSVSRCLEPHIGIAAQSHAPFFAVFAVFPEPAL